jgi:hypothetical protein
MLLTRCFVLLCVCILTIVLDLAASTWVPICTSTAVSAPLSAAASCMYPAMVYTCRSSYLWKPFHKFVVVPLPAARPTTSYDRANSDPSTSRQKRKRLLDQHRLVWRGDLPHDPLLLFVLLVPPPVAENLTTIVFVNEIGGPWHSTDHLTCGQFDEAFVEALKGTCYIVSLGFWGFQGAVRP